MCTPSEEVDVAVAGGGKVKATFVGKMNVEAIRREMNANVYSVRSLGEVVLGVEWLSAVNMQFDWDKIGREARARRRASAKMEKMVRRDERVAERTLRMMEESQEMLPAGMKAEVKCGTAAQEALTKEISAMGQCEVWGSPKSVEEARKVKNAVFVRSPCIFAKKNVQLGAEHQKWKCRLVAGGDRLSDAEGKAVHSIVPYESPAGLRSLRSVLALHAAKGD
ncbi:hypothetical protein FVE85_7781 [Porphyridium purpureum]|uniref:Uncharacterized protein n=1 Tax=Porphyridium purpureum TaxID=35688 RepID=A0A5J4YKE1_PORPP|nr:hypothetical protein FVE85_7781 [Porphyridium purpureum]|eukprot:POR5265..scf210_14